MYHLFLHGCKYCALICRRQYKALYKGETMGKKGIEQLIDEIAKCDVLCSNCHRKLHYALKETEKLRL